MVRQVERKITREEVFAFVQQKYQTKPEYLWKKNPTYAVIRQTANQKWYAIVMNVEKAKLGLTGVGQEDILDVKLPPEIVANLSEFPEFLPAYHMNKTHWLAVRLAKVDQTELFRLLEQSYQLTN